MVAPRARSRSCVFRRASQPARRSRSLRYREETLGCTRSPRNQPCTRGRTRYVARLSPILRSAAQLVGAFFCGDELPWPRSCFGGIARSWSPSQVSHRATGRSTFAAPTSSSLMADPKANWRGATRRQRRAGRAVRICRIMCAFGTLARILSSRRRHFLRLDGALDPGRGLRR